MNKNNWPSCNELLLRLMAFFRDSFHWDTSLLCEYCGVPLPQKRHFNSRCNSFIFLSLTCVLFVVGWRRISVGTVWRMSLHLYGRPMRTSWTETIRRSSLGVPLCVYVVVYVFVCVYNVVCLFFFLFFSPVNKLWHSLLPFLYVVVHAHVCGRMEVGDIAVW